MLGFLNASDSEPLLCAQEERAKAGALWKISHSSTPGPRASGRATRTQALEALNSRKEDSDAEADLEITFACHRT